MKHVQYVYQKPTANKPGGPRFVWYPPEPILILPCVSWRSGRKLTIKVGVACDGPK
jgi:hypothetical protein